MGFRLILNEMVLRGVLMGLAFQVELKGIGVGLGQGCVCIWGVGQGGSGCRVAGRFPLNKIALAGEGGGGGCVS